MADRLDRPHLGESEDDPLIDQLHRAMLYWQRGDRAALVQYLHTHDLGDHAGYWRLAQALFEVLPRGWKRNLNDIGIGRGRSASNRMRSWT